MSVSVVFHRMFVRSASTRLPTRCQNMYARCGRPPVRRDPYTTSAYPSTIGRISSITSEGSYSMSASWITTTSPVVRAIPVRTAAPSPRLRPCWSTVRPFAFPEERGAIGEAWQDGVGARGRQGLLVEWARRYPYRARPALVGGGDVERRVADQCDVVQLELDAVPLRRPAPGDRHELAADAMVGAVGAGPEIDVTREVERRELHERVSLEVAREQRLDHVRLPCQPLQRPRRA